MSENIYQAPSTIEPSAEYASTEAETIRREHIKHEATFRSIGTLYYIAGILLLIALPNISYTSASSKVSYVSIIIAIMAIVSLFLGYHVRKLKKWVSIPATILSCIGLINFPIGTIINLFILFIIWHKKSKMILSDPYKEIIKVTPHIKYRTSRAVWIILVVFLLLFLGLIVYGASRSL